jgi:hypothetical protein
VGRQTVVDERAVVGERPAVAAESDVEVELARRVERRPVLDEWLRPAQRRRLAQRPRNHRVGGDVGEQDAV